MDLVPPSAQTRLPDGWLPSQHDRAPSSATLLLPTNHQGPSRESAYWFGVSDQGPSPHSQQTPSLPSHSRHLFHAAPHTAENGVANALRSHGNLASFTVSPGQGHIHPAALMMVPPNTLAPQPNLGSGHPAQTGSAPSGTLLGGSDSKPDQLFASQSTYRQPNDSGRASSERIRTDVEAGLEADADADAEGEPELEFAADADLATDMDFDADGHWKEAERDVHLDLDDDRDPDYRDESSVPLVHGAYLTRRNSRARNMANHPLLMSLRANQMSPTLSRAGSKPSLSRSSSDSHRRGSRTRRKSASSRTKQTQTQNSSHSRKSSFNSVLTACSESKAAGGQPTHSSRGGSTGLVRNAAGINNNLEKSYLSPLDEATVALNRKNTASHLAAFGIYDEETTTLWDLKDGPEGRFGKPPYPYLTIIRIALLSSPQKKLTLQELYDAMEARYPFFDGNQRGWKNSIRHNLSLNKCFKKETRHVLDPGKGAYWYVDLNEEHSTPRVRQRSRTNETLYGQIISSATASQLQSRMGTPAGLQGPDQPVKRRRKDRDTESEAPFPFMPNESKQPTPEVDVKPRSFGSGLPAGLPGLSPMTTAFARPASANSDFPHSYTHLTSHNLSIPNVETPGIFGRYGGRQEARGRSRAISAPSPVAPSFLSRLHDVSGVLGKASSAAAEHQRSELQPLPKSEPESCDGRWDALFGDDGASPGPPALLNGTNIFSTAANHNHRAMDRWTSPPVRGPIPSKRTFSIFASHLLHLQQQALAQASGLHRPAPASFASDNGNETRATTSRTVADGTVQETPSRDSGSGATSNVPPLQGSVASISTTPAPAFGDPGQGHSKIPDSAASNLTTTMTTAGDAQDERSDEPETPRGIFNNMLRQQQLSTRLEKECGTAGVATANPKNSGSYEEVRPLPLQESLCEASDSVRVQPISTGPISGYTFPLAQPNPGSNLVFSTASNLAPTSRSATKPKLRHIPPLAFQRTTRPFPPVASPGRAHLQAQGSGACERFASHQLMTTPSGCASIVPTASVGKITPSHLAGLSLTPQDSDRMKLATNATTAQSPTRLLPQTDYDRMFSSAPFGMPYGSGSLGEGTPDFALLSASRKTSRSSSIFGIVNR